MQNSCRERRPWRSAFVYDRGTARATLQAVPPFPTDRVNHDQFASQSMIPLLQTFEGDHRVHAARAEAFQIDRDKLEAERFELR